MPVFPQPFFPLMGRYFMSFPLFPAWHIDIIYRSNDDWSNGFFIKI